MPVKVYKLDASPPARSVMMILEHFGVPYEPIDVDILGKQNFTPEYLKKNPVHSIPVYEDGDYIIRDSHAILMYLADKHAKNDTFYPKDIKERAMVNQALFFDSSILFPRLRSVTIPTIFEGKTGLTEKEKATMEEAYGMCEALLTQNKFIARDQVTIADFSCITDVDSLDSLWPIDSKKYPKTVAWIQEMSKLPAYQKYAGGVQILKSLIKDKWTS